MFDRLDQRSSAEQSVVCIACGEVLARSNAREYDKHGDRWERDGKQFEFLCKPCYRTSGQYSREGLEETLIAANAGEVTDEEFLKAFLAEENQE